METEAVVAPAPRRFPLLAVLIPVAFVLGLGVGYLFWGRDVAPNPAAAAQVEQAPQEIKRYPVPVDDDPSLGPQDARITIIEFSDFECPFCTRWHQEVWPQLQEKYPDDVRLVYRDFPLTSIHGNAASAAEAANCAGEQDAYWQYHDKLFKAESGLGASAYIQYASELGLDTAALEECLSSRRYQDEVEGDYNYAANLGVRSTPTFFLNGIPLVGAQPFEVFDEVISKELAGEIP